MNLDAEIFAALQASSGLADLIGAGNAMRAYPGKAPQEAAYPLVVFTDPANVPNVVLDGPTGNWRARYQFSVWGPDLDAAKAVAAKVMEAIQAATAFQKIPLNHFAGPVEAELNLFHRVVEFSIWYET